MGNCQAQFSPGGFVHAFVGGNTHFRYAEILHKKGDLDAARAQLDQAVSLFREMEMDWWTEQAEELGKSLEMA